MIAAKFVIIIHSHKSIAFSDLMKSFGQSYVILQRRHRLEISKTGIFETQ